MSIDVLSWVLKNSEETLGRRLVLLVLADCAHEDGTGAWPAVQTVAEKARLSKRQVQRCLKDLEASGAIAKDGTTRAGTTCWTVVMGGDNLSPRQNVTATSTTDSDAGNVTQTVIEETSKETPPSPSLPDPVLETFEHWCRVMDHPRSQLEFKRRLVIQNALKVATLDECLRAINGCALSDFHMARSEYNGRARYDSLSLILRNREKIEWFGAMAPQTGDPRAAGSGRSSTLDVRIREAKRNVLAAYDLAGSDEAVRKGDESERFLLEQGIRVVRDSESSGRPRFTSSEAPPGP